MQAAQDWGPGVRQTSGKGFSDQKRRKGGRAGHMWGQREGTAWESLLCCFGAPGTAAPREACGALQAQLPLPSPATETATFLGHPRPPGRGRHSGQQASSPAGTLRNCRRSPSAEPLATSVPHFLFLCLPSPTASISSPWPLPQSLLGGPCQQGPSPAHGRHHPQQRQLQACTLHWCTCVHTNPGRQEAVCMKPSQRYGVKCPPNSHHTQVMHPLELALPG